MDTNFICVNSRSLEELVKNFKQRNISIFDYKLYIDNESVPVILSNETDYEPYLAYSPVYVIENATFDDITYTKAIRIISPDAT